MRLSWAWREENCAEHGRKKLECNSQFVLPLIPLHIIIFSNYFPFVECERSQQPQCWARCWLLGGKTLRSPSSDAQSSSSFSHSPLLCLQKSSCVICARFAVYISRNEYTKIIYYFSFVCRRNVEAAAVVFSFEREIFFIRIFCLIIQCCRMGLSCCHWSATSVKMPSHHRRRSETKKQLKLEH